MTVLAGPERHPFGARRRSQSLHLRGILGAPTVWVATGVAYVHLRARDLVSSHSRLHLWPSVPDRISPVHTSPASEILLIRKLWPHRLRSLVKQLSDGLTADDLDSLRILIAQVGLRSRRPVLENYQFLHDAELRVFSQWGEDGILDLLCDALMLSKPSVVEFGAGNFRECNSRFLAENRSASVVAIDARSDLTSNIESSPLRWRTNIHALQQRVSP